MPKHIKTETFYFPLIQLALSNILAGRYNEGERSILITKWINFFSLWKFSLQTKVCGVQNPICRRDVK